MSQDFSTEEKFRNAARIALVGNIAGGKTLLSNHLSKELGLPLFHVDSIQFQSGWRDTPAETRDEIIREIISGEKWILDGNGYRAAMAERLRAADIVLLIHYSKARHIMRMVGRKFRYVGSQRPELPENCPETSLWHFRKLLAAILRFERVNLPKIEAILKDLPQDRVMRITDVNSFNNLLRFKARR